MHLPKACRDGAVRNGRALFGLALATIGSAPEKIGALVADAVHRVPELHRAALVRHVAKHRPELAVPDLVKHLAAELKIVTLLVDAPAAVADDVDAPLDIGEQIVERTRFRVRLERNVRHALDRKTFPALRKGATVGTRLADELCLADRHLVILEDAVFDDRKLGADRPNAIVVVADGGEAAPPWLRSATMFMSSLPYCSLPSLSGVQKVVPAKLASQPSARSSSVGWPTDSWMVSQRWVGSRTRS